MQALFIDISTFYTNIQFIIILSITITEKLVEDETCKLWDRFIINMCFITYAPVLRLNDFYLETMKSFSEYIEDLNWLIKCILPINRDFLLICQEVNVQH